MKCHDCGLPRKLKGRYRVTVVGVDYDEGSRLHAGAWAEWNLCFSCFRIRVNTGYLKIEFLGAPADVPPQSGGGNPVRW